mgnify:CR=1 FL=1
MGWIGDRLVLDHLRIAGCRHGNRVLAELDIDVGDEDAIIHDLPDRRQKSIRIANLLLARFLALEPPAEGPRLLIPKEPLRLW